MNQPSWKAHAIWARSSRSPIINHHCEELPNRTPSLHLFTARPNRSNLTSTRSAWTTMLVGFLQRLRQYSSAPAPSYIIALLLPSFCSVSSREAFR
jgi:hypothetical protein